MRQLFFLQIKKNEMRVSELLNQSLVRTGRKIFNLFGVRNEQFPRAFQFYSFLNI